MILLSNFHSGELLARLKDLFTSSIQRMVKECRKSLELSKFKSQPLYQGYKSNLPTSLTHITLYNYKLLALGTCCGLLYGFIILDRIKELLLNAK